jgi:hypothetical protein
VINQSKKSDELRALPSGRGNGVACRRDQEESPVTAEGMKRLVHDKCQSGEDRKEKKYNHSIVAPLLHFQR